MSNGAPPSQPTGQGLDLTKLDLSTLSPGPGGSKPPAGIEAKSYDPTADREKLRGTIAISLVLTLVGSIVLVALTGMLTVHLCHAKDACAADVVELKTARVVIELVLTPLVGLVGAVTGFYYGDKSASGK
jgi:hypothetical protein